jgi:hypothetical protein
VLKAAQHGPRFKTLARAMMALAISAPGIQVISRLVSSLQRLCEKYFRCMNSLEAETVG